MEQITKDQIDATLKNYYNQLDLARAKEKLIPVWFVVINLFFVLPGIIIGVFVFLKQLEVMTDMKGLIVVGVIIFYSVVSGLIVNELAWKKKKIQLVKGLGYEVIN